MTPNEWILSSDTGVSSKTIWAVMMGVITEETACGDRYDVPHDYSDFGRCYRLLERFPEWKLRLSEIATLLPKWRPLIANWDTLVAIFLRDRKNEKSTDFYDFIRPLCDEGLLLDGWKKTGPSSWSREGSTRVVL